MSDIAELAPAVAGHPPALEALHPVFDLPKAHVRMLDDRDRTARYVAAIRNVVVPDSIVVDIGTGSGVFAVAAALAGARRVYAIEAGRIAAAATALIDGNGVADRVRLVRGRSVDVELPERADVIVSEVIGREPLEQRVLEILLDARERLLKPDGRFVPRALEMHALPVSIPQAEVDEMDFTPAAAARWQGWYGIDFSALVHVRLPRVAFKNPDAVRRWTPLAPAATILDVDFLTNAETAVDVATTTNATERGTVNAGVITFDLDLDEGNVFTTRLDAAPERDAWRQAVFFVPPFEVAPGDEIALSYRYRVPGVWPGLEVAPG